MTQPVSTDSKRMRMTGAAVATPVTADGSVDHARLAAHAQRLLASGVDSLALFGTTGEGSSFDQRTKIAAIEHCLALGIAPQAIGMGVFDNAAAAAAAHCRELSALGCRYALLAPPSYFKTVADEGLYRWFSEVIAGAPAGQFVLYHIPPVTAVPLSLGLIGRLAEAFPGRLMGVKDSSGNWQYTSKLIQRYSGLTILIGHEGHLASAVQAGASGCISGLANVLPEVLYDMVRDGEPDERVDALIGQALAYPVVAALKALLAHRLADPDWRRCRAPLTALQRHAAEALAVHLDLLFNDGG